MKFAGACCLILLSAAFGRADDAALKEARQRWLRGNYAEAAKLYEKLAQDPAHRVVATIGWSRALESTGDYGKALDIIDAALKDKPQADLLARRAEMLYLAGKLQEAEKAADQAVALRADSFLARWIRSRVYWDRADLKKADDELRWFIRTYSERSSKDNDVKDPDELLLIGLAGAENARWHNLSDQFRFILSDVYGDALKQDKSFWPAELQAGLLLLEKYNRGEALEAFDKALAINPNAAEVLVGKGISALQRFEVRDAEQFAERALKINPKLVDALQLRADVHWTGGESAKAREVLDKARAINPRDESTLGRIAACLLLDKDKKAFDQLVAEVIKHNPKPGLFYFVLGERLEDRKHYPEAEIYYKKAIEARPMIPWGLNSLGMLYMRLGQEKEANTILTRAFKADEFNVRVSNTLKVLRHLEKYTTLKTSHFELRYDPKVDPVLARYMAQFLEDVYASLKKQFQYEPPGPILIEVFNNHDMFSGRTVALPDLHTIGASTGRIIAMVSPNSPSLGRHFNWARVVRHELVHVFNLEQTLFQCPHWFTEGLAVLNEGFGTPPQWNQVLKQRFDENTLLDLDSIDLGFIRPRSPLEWNLAYCQSELYIRYLRESYGAGAVAGMLACYHDGLDTKAAVEKVCHVTKPEFEKGYKAFVTKIVKKLEGKTKDKPLTYSQLLQAHDDHPDDPDISARLAEQYLLRRDRVEARKLVDAVLAKKPTHPLASYVKSRLILDSGDEEQARAILEKGLDRKNPEIKLISSLSKLYYQGKEFAKAAELLELQRQTDPADQAVLLELARVYGQMNDRPRLIDVLRAYIKSDPDELDQRKRLARLLMEENSHAEAEQMARQILEIDVNSAVGKDILERALTAQKKTDELAQVRKLLEKEAEPPKPKTEAPKKP